MNEPMLSKPKNIFERLLRNLGILKRININNHSCCDIRVINDIIVKKGQSKKLYTGGTNYKITLVVLIDGNWHMLYKDRDFDIRNDLNVYDRDVELARRNRIVLL